MIPIAVYAASPWDKYTLPPATGHNPWEQWMRSRPEMVIGWHPYQKPNVNIYRKILIYVDTYAIYLDSSYAKANPDQILKDASGNLLYIPYNCANGTCPQYAADITNPGFQKSILAGIQALKDAGYEGIFLDDVDWNWVNTSDGNGNIVIPSGFNLDNWSRHFVEFLEEVRSSFPGFTIAQNAVWWKGGDPDLAKRQIKTCNLYNMERGYGDGNYKIPNMIGQEHFVEYVHTLGGNIIQDEYSKDPNQPPAVNQLSLSDRTEWFRAGYKPGDVMVINDLFPDDKGPYWAMLDSTNPNLE